MAMDTTGTFDEALVRLHGYGPEFEGWLTNHAPMAVEAMVRHGHADAVHHWIDRYRPRLEDAPTADRPIGEDWREALGNPRRLGDWIGHFRREIDERPWQEVLTQWWPRLLPGIAAGATHPVIRTGHAVRALLDDPSGGHDSPRAVELAHALGYWAARSLPTPGVRAPAGSTPPLAALDGVPQIARGFGGYRAGLARLAETPGWSDATSALQPATTPEQARDRLTALVRDATLRYATHGHHSPVMLVHTATAPNAVLRLLPALPAELWVPSLNAAWTATAAVTALYSADTPATSPPTTPTGSPAEAAAELFARAAAHGDEHVVKFADTALDVAAAGTPDALAGVVLACNTIAPLGEE